MERVFVARRIDAAHGRDSADDKVLPTSELALFALMSAVAVG
ncbi:hypothetical protein V1279_007592 [Bradyrhizobium sp. AZCC 1610]